jgi:hypothetical protein
MSMSISVSIQGYYAISKKLIDESWDVMHATIHKQGFADDNNISFLEFLRDATFELESLYGEEVLGEESNKLIFEGITRNDIIEALVQRRESDGRTRESDDAIWF